MDIRSISAACLLFAAAASPAIAEDTTVSAVTVVAERPPVAVVWKQWPEPRQLWPYTPEKAARLGVGGWALVDCLVAADGKLTDCNAWATSNSDFAFTEAANRLTSMRPFALDVTAPGASPLAGQPVRFAIVFAIDHPYGGPSQSSDLKAPPPLCFPKDDGTVPIIATPQVADPTAAIRRC